MKIVGMEATIDNIYQSITSGSGSTGWGSLIGCGSLGGGSGGGSFGSGSAAKIVEFTVSLLLAQPDPDHGRLGCFRM